MTDRTQPAALRLAALLDADEWPGSMTLVGYARACVAELCRQHAEITDLKAQLEAIGAGGVSGPLLGQPQAMPDLSALQEWARQILSGPHDTIEGNRKINMTENTTASGAADLPEFPGHPESHNMMWTALEIVAIRKYGADMFRAGRLAASAPVAPAPQPAAPKKKPLPDLMMAAYHEAIGWNACVDAMNVAAAPKAAPGDALDEAMRERDDAEDFIDELLDEVLGADRPEWSSAYNRYDAMNDVRERITASRTPAESVGRDAERLDWLEQHSQVNIERVRYLGSDESVYEVTPYDSADYDGKTLRAAIDAAMAANGGNK